MKLDLQGLEITKGELKRLSGINLSRVFRPPTPGKFLSEGLKSFSIIALLFIGYLLLAQIRPQVYLWLFIIFVIMTLGLILEDVFKIIISARNKNLLKLFDDVDRYNAIVKAIVIHDEIEATGTTKARLSNRDGIVEALQLIRDDLVRALTMERILKKHKKFISSNAKLFASNLQEVNALLINDEASEHGRLLNEALEIAIRVENEMKRLQNRHYG